MIKPVVIPLKSLKATVALFLVATLLHSIVTMSPSYASSAEDRQQAESKREDYRTSLTTEILNSSSSPSSKTIDPATTPSTPSTISQDGERAAASTTGSFHVTRVAPFVGAGDNVKIDYSGEIIATPFGNWEVTSVSGSCTYVVEDPSGDITVSKEPVSGTFRHDLTSFPHKTILIVQASDNPFDPCYWPVPPSTGSSQTFAQDFFEANQESSCEPITIKGETEVTVGNSKYGVGKWTWDIVAPPDPTLCFEPGNQPPIPVATVDKSEVFSGETVTLDGTQSHDPDPGDSITSYQWTQIDPPGGLIGTSATVQFTSPGVDSPTTFTFGLAVQDIHGAVGATTVDVLVKPPLCPEGTSNSVTAQQISCTNPPIAVAESIPDKKVLVGDQITLDGRKSHDPDPGDRVAGFDWKKTQPSDKIVPNTLSNPFSSMPTFDVPNYIPSEFTSLGTAPRLLPLEFSLQVTDNHGLKSTNDATVSLDVVCGASDQAKAEKSRNFFLGMINYPGGSLKFPETINNFQYFISGKGDTQGLTQGVTGNGVAKSLPVMWLDNALEFKSAQRKIGGDMARDIFSMLRGMNDGESRQLVKSYAGAKYDIKDSQKIYYWTPAGSIPSDFTTAVGSANVVADVDLTVTKSSSIFGSDRVSGKVVLRLKDNYDFNPNKTFNAPPVGSTTSDEIYQLIKCLGARNFNQDTAYSKILTNFPASAIHESLARCGEGFTSGSCKIQP